MPWVPEHISLTPPTARSYRRNPDKVVARIKGYKNVKAYYAALWEALQKREQRELSAEFDVRLGRKVRSCNKPKRGTRKAA